MKYRYVLIYYFSLKKTQLIDAEAELMRPTFINYCASVCIIYEGIGVNGGRLTTML